MVTVACQFCITLVVSAVQMGKVMSVTMTRLNALNFCFVNKTIAEHLGLRETIALKNKKKRELGALRLFVKFLGLRPMS